MEANTLTFAAPIWFWAFALFPFFIAGAFAGARRRDQLLAKLVAARLAPRLAGTVSPAKRWLKLALILLALAGAIVALARPQWGFTWEESKRKGRDIIIIVDTSRSMLAEDVKPSRLLRAKLAAQDLIGTLSGDRVAIIAFAGTAFLQAPLTVDYNAALGSLKELDTEIIPQGGTNLEAALKSAREAFGKGESENRAVVVFSDGEELDANAEKLAGELKGEMRIFTVGVGTPEGALIPVRLRGGGQEFIKDEAGNVVKSKLDETRLRTIAEATGGFYLHLQNGRVEMQQLVRDGLGSMTEKDIDARLSRRPIERFQWPLGGGIAALLFAMLLGERRSRPATALARAALIAVALCPTGAQAGWWPKNPGLTQYEQAEQFAKRAQADEAKPDDPQWDAARKAYEQANDEFAKQLKRQPNSPEAHYNLGTTAYKTRKYDEAMAAFSEGLLSKKPDVQVNSRDYLGNTLYQKGAEKESKDEKLGTWKDAVKQYDDALKIDSNNAMVQGHREFVLNKIKELEQEQKQDQQKDDKKQDQKDDQKKDDKDQKQDKQDQSQSKDQQGKDKQEQQKQDQDGKGQKPDQKDGQQEDQKPGQSQDSKEQQQQQQQGKDSKDGQDKKEEGNKADNQQGQQQDSAKPEDKGQQQSQKPGEKKEGEVKAAQPGEGDKDQQDQAEAAAEAQAAAEGKMTPQQARALLESMKDEDRKVRMIDPRDKSPMKRVFKDW